MTTSDDRHSGLEALGQIARGATPTAVGVALLLAVVGIWQHLWPVGFPTRTGGVDIGIIESQIERAETIPPQLDVLIVGDSSGLMGIDAPLLSELLGGAAVESLSTLGYVGPRGYAAILERFLRRGGRTARLLIVLDSSSLVRLNTWARREHMAVNGIEAPPPPSNFFDGIRARLLTVAEPILFVPLSGPLGDFYGSFPALADYIRSHHGTAIEPGPPLFGNGQPFSWVRPYKERAAERFVMNDLFIETLPPLAKVIDQFGRDTVRLVLMPQLSWFDHEDTERRRNALFARLREALHLDPDALLNLPATLPAPLFANETHLNRKGRLLFTPLLAEALLADRERFGWRKSETTDEHR